MDIEKDFDVRQLHSQALPPHQDKISENRM
jgi:hypothetical protein